VTKAKKNIKHINSFLDTNTIGMTDDEFQKHDKLFQKELAGTVDLKKLVDYFLATKDFKHPAMAKHQRIFVRMRMIEVIKAVDPANPPDWIWIIVEPKNGILPFLIPTLRRKLHEILKHEA